MKIFTKLTPKGENLNPPQDLKCTIRLLDDNEAINYEFTNTTLGQQALDFVAQKLDLLEKDYFGLRYMESNKQRNWVDPVKPLLKQLKNVCLYVLCFRVRFYPPHPENLQEEITKYYLFSQLRRDLLHGRLFISQTDGPVLAAYILQSEIGDYEPEEMDPGYVSKYKLLAKQTPYVEEKICEIHKSLKGQVPSEAEMNFLQKASQLETYGIDPYPVKDQKGNHMYLGINYSGIMTFQSNIKIHHFIWDQIRKIDFDGKVLVIHLFIDEKKHVIGFKCPTQASCKHIWKSAIEQRDFFHLRSSTETKIHHAGGGLFSRGSKYRYSGRVEREVLDNGEKLVPGRIRPHVVRNSSFKEISRRKGGTYFSDKAKPLIYNNNPKVFTSNSTNYPDTMVKRPRSHLNDDTSTHNGTFSVFKDNSFDSRASPASSDVSPTKSISNAAKSSSRTPPDRPPPPNLASSETSRYNNNLNDSSKIVRAYTPSDEIKSYGNSMKQPSSAQVRDQFKHYSTHDDQVNNRKGRPEVDSVVAERLRIESNTSLTMDRDDHEDHHPHLFQTYVESPSPTSKGTKPPRPPLSFKKVGTQDFTSSHRSNNPLTPSFTAPDSSRNTAEAFITPTKDIANENIDNYVAVVSPTPAEKSKAPADEVRKYSEATTAFRKAFKLEKNAGGEDDSIDEALNEDELLREANNEILRLQKDKKNHLSKLPLNLSNTPRTITSTIGSSSSLLLSGKNENVKGQQPTTSPTKQFLSDTLLSKGSTLLSKFSPTLATKLDSIMQRHLSNGTAHTLTTAKGTTKSSHLNKDGIIEDKNLKYPTQSTSSSIATKAKRNAVNGPTARHISWHHHDNESEDRGDNRNNNIVAQPSRVMNLPKFILLILIALLITVAFVLLMESHNPNALRLYRAYPQLQRFQRDTYGPIKKDVLKYWDRVLRI